MIMNGGWVQKELEESDNYHFLKYYPKENHKKFEHGL